MIGPATPIPPATCQKTAKAVPRQVNIMGTWFEVKVVNKMDDWGDCDGSRRIIRLNKNQSAQNLLSTFLHECIHACLYVSGAHAWLKEKQEESVVMALEHGLIPILNAHGHIFCRSSDDDSN